MMEKKKGLGRGLESLLPSRQGMGGRLERSQVSDPTLSPNSGVIRVGHPQNPAEVPERSDGLVGAREIPIGLIDRNPYQTRGKIDEGGLEELASSIREQGVLQPILVREIRNANPTLLADDARRMGHPEGESSHVSFANVGQQDDGIRYQLMAGERRWLASIRAGLKTMPAVVKQASDEQAMEITIIENLQREDLNPMEQARAFDRLSREFRLTQELIAVKTGKERTTISNFLRLLKLPNVVQQAIEEGTLSLGHGKVLMMLQNEPAEMVARVAEKAIADHVSVRQLEEMVQRLMSPGTSGGPRKTEARDPNVRAAEEEIQRTLGCKVTINDKGGKGKIILEYSSLEDFDRVVDVLGRR